MAQAILTYIMSCFALSSTFYVDIQQLLNSFLWGESQGKRKIH